MTDDQSEAPREIPVGAGVLAWGGRRKLRKYLKRLEHAKEIRDLGARETSLGEIRAAIHQDLAKREITNRHYSAVVAPLDEAIKRMRLESVEEKFSELPFHVVAALQDVLEDNRVDPDEIEMVEDMMKRERLSENDKQRVLDRLHRWRIMDEVGRK